MPLRSCTSIFVAASFLIILISGCDDRTINPFEEDEAVFSIYSAVSVNESPNYVRVRKLDTPLFADSTVGVNATVTFTNLGTGQSSVLRDTVVNFDGNFTQNFIIEDQLEIDNQYRILVEGSDGRRSSSVATTPRQTEVTFSPSEFTDTPSGRIKNLQCETRMEFVFKNVRKPEFVEMEIGVQYQGEERWAPMEIVGELEHRQGSDTEMVVFMSPRNLLVEVFPPILPDNPFFDRYRLFPTVNCAQLDNDQFKIRYRHYGPEWGNVRANSSTSGPLDFEAGDVESGIGFFGAYSGGEFSFEIRRNEN